MKLRCCCLSSLILLALLESLTVAQTNTASIDVKVVEYSELAEIVRGHRGKVVVVDFWATFCPPCVAELPHLVTMHKRFESQGLVTISVSLDQINQDSAVRNKVVDSLKKVDARMTNLILDEEFSFVQKKMGCDGPPCAFVFNRRGKWKRFIEVQFRHDLIEQTVIQFLKEE